MSLVLLSKLVQENITTEHFRFFRDMTMSYIYNWSGMKAYLHIVRPGLVDLLPKVGSHFPAFNVLHQILLGITDLPEKTTT